MTTQHTPGSYQLAALIVIKEICCPAGISHIPYSAELTQTIQMIARDAIAKATNDGRE